jgi:hypothetical protein
MPPVPSATAEGHEESLHEAFISPLDPLFPDRTPRPSVSNGHSHGHGAITFQSSPHDSQRRVPVASDFGLLTTSHHASHPALSSSSSGRNISGHRSSRPERENRSGHQEVRRRDQHSSSSRRDGATGSTSSPTSDHERLPPVTHRRPPEDDDIMSETASLHTFGQAGNISTKTSNPSSRASSRLGYADAEDGEALFSSDAESEIFFDDDISPVFGDDGDEDDIILTTRRGSLPLDIPMSSTSPKHRIFVEDVSDMDARDREPSLATLRRPSRSLDDDLRLLNTGAAAAAAQGTEPKSEPLSKGDWRSLDAQMQVRQAEETAASPELDLNYIFNLPPGLGMVRPGGALDPISASRRSSDAQSYIQRRQSKGNKAGFGFFGARRPSTATVNTYGSGEDAFDRQLRKQDSGFAERKELWSFRKERADGGLDVTGPARRGSHVSTLVAGPSTLSQVPEKGKEKEKSSSRIMTPGSQEIWRCMFVGRFKVDMQEIRECHLLALATSSIKHRFVDTDPSKPSQRRLNVRHIIDPFNKGNTRGGPLQLVHKHSRAVAYSLYRAYNMYISYGRHAVPRPGEFTSSIVSMRGKAPAPGRKPAVNILLAPRRVQEEYTSTRTTSKLRDHGLLTEPARIESSGRSTSRSASGSGSGSTSQRTRERERQQVNETDAAREAKWLREREVAMRRADEEAIRRQKAKEREIEMCLAIVADVRTDGRELSSPTPTIPVTMIHDPAIPGSPRSPDLIGRPSMSSFETDDSHVPSIGEVVITGPSTASATSLSDKSTLVSLTLVPDLASISSNASDYDSDESRPPTRTPHSEAFDTLDPKLVEYVRSRADHRHIDSSSNSVFSRIMRRLGTSNSRSHPPFPPGLTPASLEGAYAPKWLTLAPRTKTENQERALQSLNESFRDVGLLPSRKPSSSGSKPATRKSSRRVNVFEQVPEDSLYMLLPLWPGETDPASAIADTEEYSIGPDDRMYLLVYYVPFDKVRSVKFKKQRSGGPGAVSSSEGSSNSIEQRRGHLTTFRGCARLVSYDELRGSGIRLPSDGLAVTGSIREAMRLIPTHRDRPEFNTEIVIASCFGKDQGVELVPEGFDKLGLCMPRPEHDPEEEVEFQLTPIGRAAAELTWLAGIAMMSFGSD